ncbi:MAG: NAD(P)H-binding protein, partial [Eudoraea sp.]|nr:NAD(P)H-binding protein [Eudoraea sp.]
PFIILFYFLDKEKQEGLIEKSDLDWTIVRPGQLTNGRKKGQYKHGKGLGNYVLTKMISRADVANFILQELEGNNYGRKVAEITY